MSWLTWTIPRIWSSSSILDNDQPRVAGGDGSTQRVSDRLGDVDGHDRRNRRHHLARLLLVQVEDAGQHLGLADVELTASLRLGDEPLELLGRAVRGLGVGIDAEPAQHPLRGGVEREDERPEDDR